MTKIFTVRMPDIGEGVVEGEVIEWLKKEGDLVAKDEPVVVVMTDKATVELPSPYSGTLAKQHCKVGEMAVKDHALYDIQTEGEEIAQKLVGEEKKDKQQLHPIHTDVLAEPPARQLAKELGIDIQLIQGTGKDGRITKEDVQHYKVNPHENQIPLRGIQQLMAQKVSESKKNIPHFSYFDQGDATSLVALKDKMGKESSLTYMPFFIKALSLCMNKFPLVNSSLDTKQNVIIVHPFHHIGIAMATSSGLIVAVIKHVEKMTLSEIIQSYETLKTKGQKGTLSAQELKDSTITITNFGALTGKGVFATPIINYPEAAILGLAKIHQAPVVLDNQVQIRDILNCSWSFDHRIIDGALAANVSSEFVRIIEHPQEFLK